MKIKFGNNDILVKKAIRSSELFGKFFWCLNKFQTIKRQALREQLGDAFKVSATCIS